MARYKVDFRDGCSDWELSNHRTLKGAISRITALFNSTGDDDDVSLQLVDGETIISDLHGRSGIVQTMWHEQLPALAKEAHEQDVKNAFRKVYGKGWEKEYEKLVVDAKTT